MSADGLHRHGSQASTGALAPLPPAAIGPVIPESGYLRAEVGEKVHVVTDGSFQMMFLVSDEGVVVVDAPPTIGANMLRAIAEVTTAPVTHFVYSHHHADHVGAASLLPDDAVRYAHRDTARLLERMDDPNRPAPTLVFDESHTLEVGGETLKLDYLGPNHSPGNLFIYAPRQRVLMLVDVIFPGWVPFASLGFSTDIPGWVTAHEQALDYPFETFVGGHLARLGTREDVVTQQEYVTELRDRLEYEYANVDMAAVFGSVDPANSWAVFNAYLEAVANAATEYLVPRWTGRLGGADVFTKSNALTMSEALRIDYGVVGSTRT